MPSTATPRPPRPSRLVREGRAECLMKGSLHTDELMGAVVAREGRLRTARRISHCFVMDVPTYSEALIVSDAAVNIAPSLEDKVDIVQNAIDLAHALGAQEVRVAILSAMETVNPKVPSTIEAAALCKMADRGQITGGILDGPLALDNAINLQAAQIKQISSPVAGRANVLIVPDLEAGNMLAKSLTFLADADAAGIVLGARVPIILTSRADSVTARLASCAVAVARRPQARREALSKARGVSMSDAIAVLNAGSSSIKFSLFVAARGRSGAWRCAGRSKASTPAPHFVAKDRGGKLEAEKSWGEGVKLGHAGALDHLIAFLRERLAGDRLIGVGHRVVHGGLEYTPAGAPGREVLEALEKFIPLAPLHQPHNLAPIRLLLERAPQLPQVACFDTSFHRTQPGARADVRAAAGAARARRAPLRLPRPVLRVRRFGAAGVRCHGGRGRRPWCCTWATARACARSRRARAWPAPWASPPWKGCRWARAAARSIRACCST